MILRSTAPQSCFSWKTVTLLLKTALNMYVNNASTFLHYWHIISKTFLAQNWFIKIPFSTAYTFNWSFSAVLKHGSWPELQKIGLLPLTTFGTIFTNNDSLLCSLCHFDATTTDQLCFIFVFLCFCSHCNGRHRISACIHSYFSVLRRPLHFLTGIMLGCVAIAGVNFCIS